MVGELVGHVLVPACDGVACKAEHDPVDAAKVVHVGRVVELLVQLHEEGHLAELLVAAAHAVGGCNILKSLNGACTYNYVCKIFGFFDPPS